MTTGTGGAEELRIDPIGTGRLGVIVRSISDDVFERGGRALVVGGAVRDALMASRSSMANAPKDIDVEVFGLNAEDLLEVVSNYGEVTTAGASFAVFKLAGLALDVSLPRTEHKSGTGHRGFLVNADPSMTPARAALRRDFTINAVLWDPRSGEVVDPVGGVDDLAAGVLRHVSPAFAEDPLRVLRAAQFVSRFDLRVEPATIEACRSLLAEAAHLPRERVADEWEKLLRGARPGRGLRFLDECGWLESMQPLPELRTSHSADRQSGLDLTIAALDRWAAARDQAALDTTGVISTGFAVLCHLLDGAGIERLEALHQRPMPRSEEALARLTHKDAVRSEAIMLTRYHGALLRLAHETELPATVRRLAHLTRGKLDKLLLVDGAISGDEATPDVVGVLDRARACAVDQGVLDRPPAPLLGGDDLISLGYVPGPQLGLALREALDAQLDGLVTTAHEALERARTSMRPSPPDT